MAGSYWAKRLQEQQDILYKKGLNAQKKQLTSYYKQAIADTQNDISKLYDQIQKESATVSLPFWQICGILYPR